MSEKKILSIASEIPGGFSDYVDIDSDMSLLDGDIIIFLPNIYSLVGSYDSYKGKPSLSDDRSFQLRERMEHWGREISDAVLTCPPKTGPDVKLVIWIN